jgi:hypothetical protein
VRQPIAPVPLACRWYGDVPWEEIPKDANERPVPGAMFWMKFSGGHCSEHEPPCQHHLMAVTPDGHWWDIDGRASNCSNRSDKRHRCWVRHGEPPHITVDKAGLTCSAGAGSIQTDQWHGFLSNGVFDVSPRPHIMNDKTKPAGKNDPPAASAVSEEATTTKTIAVPKSDAVSALSGVSVVALDTDPEPSLAIMKANIVHNGWTLLSVIQHEFHGRTPGFIVVYYDPKADKGRQQEPQA